MTSSSTSSSSSSSSSSFSSSACHRRSRRAAATKTTVTAAAAAATSLVLFLFASTARAGTDFNANAANPVARPLTFSEKFALLYEQRLPPFGFTVGALNNANARYVRTLCDQPYASSTSLSPSALSYVGKIQAANGDGYNASIGLPLSIWSVCQTEIDRPVCEFLWTPGAKATGLKTIADVPKGVKLVDCSLYFDGTVVTSPSCWDGANIFGPTGKTLVKSLNPAQQIQLINFTVNAIDENPVPGSDVAANGGKFQVRYTHCQFAENTQIALFNRVNQVLVTDPRLTGWTIPDVGEFGDSGTLRGKNMTTGRPVYLGVNGTLKPLKQQVPLGPGSQALG